MKQVNLRICRMILPLLLGMFFSVGAYAQDITVRGHVKDAFGDPVIGANVVVKGTSNGTITDVDGNFTLSAPQNSVIEVSFIGYKTVSSQTTSSLVITLEDDSILLEEAVVIGYGTVRKNDITGSVTAIKPDEMNRGLTTNPQDMLAGKIAGVSVISDGGTPGGSAQIRIRGGSSLSASNDPLIVIDGLAMDNDGVKGLPNALAMVNPNDIETFTVLKDASATAIYGSRASNGVIIITTKKGVAGSKPRVAYNGNVSLSTVKKTLDVMDGDQFRDFVSNIFGTDSDAYRTLGNANTDWQDEIYRPAWSTDHNLTISGGLQNMPYRLSLGYTNQNGIVETSKFERYTAAINLSPSLLDDHLKINANLKGMIAKNRYADGGAIGNASSYDPTQPVYSNEDVYQDFFGGFFQWTQAATGALGDPTWTALRHDQAPANPVSMLKMKNDRATSKSLIGNLELDYKLHFFPDLRLHMNAGMDLSTGKQNTDISPYSGTNNYYGNYGWEEIDKYNLSFNAYAQYTKSLGVHNIDAMAGYEWQHFHRKGSNLYRGFYRDTHTTNPGEEYSPSSRQWKGENFLVSFFGRANYSLLDRYLFTVTLRQDGSSRFHKDHRWGTFPSFALGWRIKEEAFLRDVDVLSDLKLRLGYGITGQQNIGYDYAYLATYVANETGAYYPIGYGKGENLRPDAINEGLKWEETTTYNVGLDFGFLNGRISGSFDYYFRKTDDLLNEVSVAAGTNFKNRVISNIGSMENKGVEFSLNTKPIVNRDLTWDLGFNITYNDNKITKLTGSNEAGYYVGTGDISSGTGGNIQAHAVGYPASSFQVYQQVYDEVGKPIEGVFVDRNGDGVINDEDRYFYKKPTADVLMGLTSKIIYKSWDFSFSLRASLNNYMYHDVKAGRSEVKPTSIYAFDAFLNNRPLMVIGNNFQGVENYWLSDYFIENASFLKCDNITLGYSFNKLFGLNVSGRAYATVQNVFTITNYTGLDPEINSGIDNNIYPRPFVSMLGLSLNF